MKKEIQKLSYEQEDADIRSGIETLKSISKLLEKPSDICKKMGKQSDTDTSLTKTSLAKAEGESEENVVKYNVTIKVDSETEDEIKSSVTEVVEEIVRKIDEENSDNYKSEPLHKGSVELTDNLYMENTGKKLVMLALMQAQVSHQKMASLRQKEVELPHRPILFMVINLLMVM